MPTTIIELSEKEIKLACLHWIQDGCPTPKGRVSVYLSVDRPANANQFDPGRGVTASVEIGVSDT